MSATGTPTPNLGLRIPLGTDPASVDDINYNSNALDTIIGDVGETPVAGQLGAANNRISAVQAGLAIVCNGNTHAAIESGQFAYVKNHGTLAEGLYRNNTGSTIAANATLSSSNLTADSSGGLNTVYESLNGNIASLGTPVSWTPSMSGATLTNVGSNYVKIGKLVYLFCAFSCDIAVGDSGILDIAIPSAVAPGNDFQTVFTPVCINAGKQLYGRIYSNGLHIFNISGQSLDAGATYQMFVVYAIE